MSHHNSPCSSPTVNRHDVLLAPLPRLFHAKRPSGAVVRSTSVIALAICRLAIAIRCTICRRRQIPITLVVGPRPHGKGATPWLDIVDVAHSIDACPAVDVIVDMAAAPALGPNSHWQRTIDTSCSASVRGWISDSTAAKQLFNNGQHHSVPWKKISEHVLSAWYSAIPAECGDCILAVRVQVIATQWPDPGGWIIAAQLLCLIQAP